MAGLRLLVISHQFADVPLLPLSGANLVAFALINLRSVVYALIDPRAMPGLRVDGVARDRSVRYS